MALSNGNGEGGDKAFVNLKLVAPAGPVEEKTDEPKFVVLDSDFKETGDKYTELSGKLIKIKGSFTAAKGKMGDIYGFKAFLEDEEENTIYVLESTITNASKDMLNSLLTSIGSKVRINLYLNKNKYPTATVKGEDGKHMSQKFDYKALDNVALYDEAKRLEGESESAKENAVGDVDALSVADVPF